jgi:ATP/maltotriose-dependent transcriptional regulator MalT
MTLAQVVYQYSTDAGFASRMRSDPLAALAERGLRLSKEEIDLFLSQIIRFPEVKIQDLIKNFKGWA